MKQLQFVGLFGGGALLHWLGVAVDYLVAGGLIAAGIWVALYWQHRFARIIGLMLVGCGVGWGCFAYGKTIGGAACYSEWSAANKKADRAIKERDLAIHKLAREMAQRDSEELAKQNFDLQKQVAEYAEYVAKNTNDRCRLSTPDDVDRLCAIGRGPGCPKDKR